MIFSIFLFIISGCASKQKYISQQYSNLKKPDLIILDKRPDKEKYDEILSVNISSDNYGIFRIGDNQMVPDRIIYLANRLESKSNNKLLNKSIVLNNFEIHNNLQKLLRRGVTAGAFGLVGGLVYTGLTETPDALIDVNLAFTVDNKQYSSHLIRGYRFPDDTKGSSDQVAAEIYTAIDETIDRIVMQL